MRMRILIIVVIIVCFLTINVARKLKKERLREELRKRPTIKVNLSETGSIPDYRSGRI